MKKRCDDKNRWRNKVVSFRMSAEEAKQLDIYVHLSGLSKQDYLIKKVLDRKVVIYGSPRTYKALRNQLFDVNQQLQRLAIVDSQQDELIALIDHISDILHEFKEERHEQ